MLGILKYIIKKNNGVNILKYLFLGLSFQLFKRVTNSVVSKKLFNKQRLFLYPQCNVSSMYAYTDIPDKEEIMILRSLIKTNESNVNSVFLDIGANIGSYSVSMMDLCNRIIAFEPHPYTSQRCKMNFLLNEFSETNVKQLALSNEVGKIHFSDYGGSSTINHITESGGIEVEVTTLDKFIDDNNFSKNDEYIIKVDVEGFEQQVFEGGKVFLTTYNIRGIVFECFSKDGVFDVLKSYGYKNIIKLSENNYIAKKISWIDNLKFFGILAVILGHIASPLGSFIYSWHMPLFFILAGFFIKFDLSIKDFIKKDFKRLMIPYFIFTFIGLSLETLKRVALHRDSLDYIHELKGVYIWMDMSSLINSYAFVLWFLPTLFFARVFLLVICKYIQNIIFQFIVVSILFSISFYVELPFAVDNSLNAILFLFIGNIFFKYYQDFKLLCILPIIGLGLYFFIGIPSLDMARKFYSDIFINLFFALAIIYSMIIILKKLDFTSRLFNTWGSNTMLLFIVHPYTNNIGHIIVEKVHFGDWYLKFFISFILLHFILLFKLRLDNQGVFRYV